MRCVISQYCSHAQLSVKNNFSSEIRQKDQSIASFSHRVALKNADRYLLLAPLFPQTGDRQWIQWNLVNLSHSLRGRKKKNITSYAHHTPSNHHIAWQHFGMSTFCGPWQTYIFLPIFIIWPYFLLFSMVCKTTFFVIQIIFDAHFSLLCTQIGNCLHIYALIWDIFLGYFL